MLPPSCVPRTRSASDPRSYQGGYRALTARGSQMLATERPTSTERLSLAMVGSAGVTEQGCRSDSSDVGGQGPTDALLAEPR
jgi:hypothetical protein